MLSAGLVIVSYGSAAFLPACLSTLFENLAEYPAAQVALVENHPGQAERWATEHAVAPYLSRGLQYLVAPKNLGYGGGANWGWQQLGQPEVNIVLNPDMSFPPGWLARFIAPFEKDVQIGIVGCKLLAGDSTIQHAGGLLRRGVALAQHFGYGESDDGRWDEACEVEFVTGAALGLRGAVLEQLGGFDPAYFPGYYEDVDLCWRARKAGWRVWYEAGAVANHFEGATFGRDTGYYRALHRNRLRFVLQNLSATTILNEFVPAERLRLLGTLADLDRQASAAIYRAAVLSLAAPPVKNDKSTKPKKENMKTDSNETFSRYNPAFEEINEQELALAERVNEEAQEVKKRWLVEEAPFTSRLPFVAALRERFNSISTRWYIKPILAQQVEFNAAVSRSIEDLSKLAMGNGPATDMQTATLASRMLALEERLDRIEKLLERLTPPEQV